MVQASAASRSITRQQYEEGIVTLRDSVRSNALKYKWLHLVAWELAENSWELFGNLRESSCCDKDGLRLWINNFVNNAIGFQLPTREFMLYLLLISFTKVESNRGRRKGAATIRRTSEIFFFDAAEEDKRLQRVLWNLRKYFHVEIADSEVNGLTTIHHERFATVSDWSDDGQVTRFLNSIRPSNNTGGESPKSNKKSRVGRKPKSPKQTKGKNAIKPEPSWSSDSEPDVSYFSSEESYSHEAAAGAAAYTAQSSDSMAIEGYENRAGSNFSINESVQFAQEFMLAPPRTFNFEEVLQYSISRLHQVWSTNEPERIQSYLDHLDAFFNPASASANVYAENFPY